MYSRQTTQKSPLRTAISKGQMHDVQIMRQHSFYTRRTHLSSVYSQGQVISCRITVGGVRLKVSGSWAFVMFWLYFAETAKTKA